jgi:hypothetical protein
MSHASNRFLNLMLIALFVGLVGWAWLRPQPALIRARR